MKALDAVEKMNDAKKLWMKQEPYTDEELKRVKQYLFNYYQLIEDTLKILEIKIWIVTSFDRNSSITIINNILYK